MEIKPEKARRYDTGKPRMNLDPVNARLKVVDVYTRGAHKYSVYEDEDGSPILGKDIPYEDAWKYNMIDDGADNWKRGQSWMKAMASVERHIAKWKLREDIDEDLGTLHLGNAIWGLQTLLEFQELHPELDDRPKIIGFKKYGLDIDSVLSDFTTYFLKYLGLDETPAIHWNDPRIVANFHKIKGDKDFFLEMPILNGPENIVYEPTCYITARSVPAEWTEEWLDRRGFPRAKVYSVGRYDSKLAVAKEAGISVFLDDKFENYLELNQEGIKCYLFTASHNVKFDVGPDRIDNFNQFNKLLEIRR